MKLGYLNNGYQHFFLECNIFYRFSKMPHCILYYWAAHPPAHREKKLM